MGSGSQRSELRELSATLAQLNSILSDRSSDDRATLTAVRGSAEVAARAIENSVFASLFSEIILVVDRMRDGEPSGEMLQSVEEELIDVCGRYGLKRVDEFERFDPKLHEAVSSVPAADADQDGRILSIEREGYLLNGRLLRPARVSVLRYVQSAGEQDGK